MSAPTLEITNLHLASGKWIASKTDFNDGLVTIAHCGEWRVGVETGIKGGNYRDWDGGNDEAHARLFAAAPMLLEAAERALELLKTGAPGWGVAKDLLNAAIHEAHGA